MYVIQRTDGAFVTPAGSAKSYTRELRRARIYRTCERAILDLCEDNEHVIAVEDLLQRPDPHG